MNSKLQIPIARYKLIIAKFVAEYNSGSFAAVRLHKITYSLNMTGTSSERKTKALETLLSSARRFLIYPNFQN